MDISRRSFLAAAAAGIAGSVGAAGAEDGGKRPNIVFIFSDDHAQQAVGAYGSVVNKTPNIDRIAREGALFLHNTCCNSICGPSRAAVLTGKHSHINGFRSNLDTFDGSQQTFPKMLQAAGYDTAMVGKWHLKTDPTGFDYWDILPDQGNYYNPDFIDAKGKRRIEGYVTDIITRLSIDWLEKGRDPGKPFLLMCQHKAPHRTWAPAPDKLTLYNDVTIPEPPTLFDDYAHRAPVLAQNEAQIAKHMMFDYDLKVPGLGIPDALGRDRPDPETPRMTPAQKAQWDAAYAPVKEAFLKQNPQGEDLVRWKYQRYMKDYLRCISSVDDSVGAVLDYLDKHGLAENTIVIYSSDQGFYLGEHGIYDKRWMYGESLAMPLLVRWPGRVKPGTRIDRLTQNIDFAPTMLEAAGIAAPGDVQGRSFVPLLEGKTPQDWRDAIYYHYYEVGEHHVPRHEGVSTEQYKLIHYYDVDQWELFDLKSDPHEMRSVYDDPAYAGVLAEMKKRLEELKVRYAVPPPGPLPKPPEKKSKAK